jgi:hypothetical protein
MVKSLQVIEIIKQKAAAETGPVDEKAGTDKAKKQ